MRLHFINLIAVYIIGGCWNWHTGRTDLPTGLMRWINKIRGGSNPSPPTTLTRRYFSFAFLLFVAIEFPL